MRFMGLGPSSCSGLRAGFKAQPLLSAVSDIYLGSRRQFESSFTCTFCLINRLAFTTVCTVITPLSTLVNYLSFKSDNVVGKSH